MNPRIGTQISLLPIPGLQKIRDLLFYDGPLLAEFESDGEKYLYYWCDTFDEFQTWMIVRVKKLPFFKYLIREISLRELILDCPDRFVYLVDLDGDAVAQRIFFATLQELPSNYLPTEDSFYDSKYGEVRTENSCIIFMDGDWKLTEFGDFPKYLADVYTYIYAAGLQSEQEMPRHVFKMDWGGRGFTSSAFFKSLYYGIPTVDKPTMNEMQINSPGYIKVNMNPQIGSIINFVVSQYHSNEQEISKKYRFLHKWVNRDRRVAKEEYHSVSIEKAARDLVDKLGYISWAKLEDASGKDLESMIQSILAYKRRLERLTKFQRKGLVTFVQVP